MKSRIIAPVIAAILLSSCSTARVAKIASETIPLQSNGYVYENDSVRINYRFWEYKGKMEFDIYNKTDAPLYFDWKISAYMPNDKRLSYYQDLDSAEVILYDSTLYGGLGVSADIIFWPNLKRIGSVPPHSLITNNMFTLVERIDEVKKSGFFDNYNTPLRFRNYLTLYTNEAFQGKLSIIDNVFYVASIKKVPSNKVDSYMSPTAFYITGHDTYQQSNSKPYIFKTPINSDNFNRQDYDPSKPRVNRSTPLEPGNSKKQ